MRQSIRLGRVKGVPVGAHWSALAVLVLIVTVLATRILPAADSHPSTALAWAVAIPTGAVFLASLLAHEAAHAVVARRHGMRVKSVTLWLLGGIAELEDEPPDWRTDLRVAFAGPATSLAIGATATAGAYAAHAVGAPDLVALALMWTGVMNLILGVFNLLPGAPLDGGRVLRALVWRHTGDRERALQSAARAGRRLGGAFLALGVLLILTGATGDGLWFVLLGWFVMTAARGEAVQSTLAHSLDGLTVADVMTPHPDTIASWTSVADAADRVALQSRQTVFPLLDLDAFPGGAVTLDALGAVPAPLRAATRVSVLALPTPAPLTPDDPADSALAALRTAPAAVLVTQDGRLVGMVTHDDVNRVLHQAPLRGRKAA
ncbi:site-2 protease family protein [Yinghuangia seranimata]|uniref:site-2 protease family protein n=1 Tax=Yinghuangia seranimata TaxID=408067 RepID=UPI00248C6B88|nr:site-2 protease family protein [Yinghuangia seranimata]MDI2129511.1 site-2 protease family protein [Yinghuangia seranimata]